MREKRSLEETSKHLSYLYSFARQINELDFAASLSGEFRGMQDAGWSTTITAHEVYAEISVWMQRQPPYTKSELRVGLMLYCQLAEAGGFYETLKNIMGIVVLKPYLLWPFQDLVRVRREPRRVIGPNANATFRDLATTAKQIGLSRLSFLMESSFRDDVRNGIYHADYVIWDDGLRLRNRNGGNATTIAFDELGGILTRGVGFFQMVQELNAISVRSFNPPREIVGRFSANFPMPWTVSFDPNTGSFGLSGSSPGPVFTPEYKRQVEINNRLGGKVLALYSDRRGSLGEKLEEYIFSAGFEPHSVEMNQTQSSQLVDDVERFDLWDNRSGGKQGGELLLASPWGFRWLRQLSDFDETLPDQLVSFDFDEDDDESGKRRNEQSSEASSGP